jgi:hypothetical protein
MLLRAPLALAVCALIISSGCSDDPKPADDPDAAPSQDPPDAGDGEEEETCSGTLEACGSACVDTATDPDHCGECGAACSPASSCSAAACACPSTFLGPDVPVIAAQMLAAQPGFLSGVVAVTGTDVRTHAVIVTATADAATDQVLDMNGQVYVAISYDVIGTTYARSAYLASAGTVRLTRRCAGGIAGSMENVTLSEIDLATLLPVPDACATTIASLAFDIGAACP